MTAVVREGPEVAASAEVRVSTRQLVDVAVRSLRARGLCHAAARAAAEVVEELEAVEGAGVSTLSAALHGPVAPPEVSGGRVVAAGCSAVLAVEVVADLLCTRDAADVEAVAGPEALLAALRVVAARRGAPWRALWSAPGGGTAGCAVLADGSACRWDGAPADATTAGTPADIGVDVRVEAGGPPRCHPAPLVTHLPDRDEALAAARGDGIGVPTAVWAGLRESARDFLVDDPPTPM